MGRTLKKYPDFPYILCFCSGKAKGIRIGQLKYTFNNGDLTWTEELYYYNCPRCGRNLAKGEAT